MENGQVGSRKRLMPTRGHCVSMGEYVLRSDLEDPDEATLEKAREELREIPEVTEAAMKELKRLIAEEPNLFVPDDDLMLVTFLRPCKWYPTSAFNLMKRFFQYKHAHQDICKNLLPCLEEKVFTRGILFPSPVRTQDGCRVFIVDCGRRWNPKEIDSVSLFRGTMMVLEGGMFEPKTQICGVQGIINFDGLSLSHITAVSPMLAATVCEWVQKCVPCRLKGIHIINQPFIFNMLFALFKPFIMEKTRKRLHFHGTNRASLFSFVSPEAVPVELGGKLNVDRDVVGKAVYKFFHSEEEQFKDFGRFGWKVNAGDKK